LAFLALFGFILKFFFSGNPAEAAH